MPFPLIVAVTDRQTDRQTEVSFLSLQFRHPIQSGCSLQLFATHFPKGGLKSTLQIQTTRNSRPSLCWMSRIQKPAAFSDRAVVSYLDFVCFFSPGWNWQKVDILLLSLLHLLLLLLLLLLFRLLLVILLNIYLPGYRASLLNAGGQIM